MLSDSQRAAVAAQLRRDRSAGAAGRIGRRDPAIQTPPASFGQEQLWFVDKLAPGQAVYNIPCLISIRGPLEVGALGRALGRLVERHEALRTRLVTSDGMTGDGMPAEAGRPVQVIDPPAPVRLGLEDLAGFEPGKRQARLLEIIHAEAVRPFDLAAGPLLRVCLVRLSETEHMLVAMAHHAVFDGWSARVFLADLAELYRAEVAGEPPRLAELPVQFADYAVWERDRLQGRTVAELEEYWRSGLDGFETVQFPADRLRPAIDSFAGAVSERMTDAGLLTALRELSRQQGSTLFATLMAGVLALLHRYTGQTDLVVGTVSANRARRELAPLIGFLVNMLPIRCDLSGDLPFTDVLARVKDATIGAFAHQDLPFGKLVDTIKTERDASRAPVFQIAFSYAEPDGAPVSSADGVEFAASDLVPSPGIAKFDLTFVGEARRDGLRLECNYKTALFDPGTIERLLAHLETLLRGAVADPVARLSELPLLTDAELRAELADWNGGAVGPQPGTASAPPGCVHERFEAQAASIPDAVAAEFEGQPLSYAELNRQANQIARRLRDLGVGPEVLVGICMPAGPRRLAAVLSVLKAGGGYVPLDPALPAGRLAFMIADSGMTVILADSSSTGSVPDSGAVVLSLDDEWDQITGLDGTDLTETDLTPENVAYVIYTSGSTGQPKGVVVEHRSLVNFAHAMIGEWEIGPGSTVLACSSFAFDASIIDMFVPLLGGARVVLAAAGTLHSPARVAALLRDAHVTFVFLSPAVLDLLPAGEYPDLRVLMTGAEEPPPGLVRRWVRPGLRLVNAYGPTEGTVIATYAELDAGTPMPPPIGFPLRPNCRAYVLDQHLNPVPVGVPGELYVGGLGVARGYLNRPDLTRERFIPDPFSAHPSTAGQRQLGERLYKTGDLARRRADGSIVFCGRLDGQVKIHGVRIELGEVEAALTTHPAIAQAIVTVTEQAGDQRLVAYLRRTPASGTVSGEQVRAHLARILPAWMIPAHLVMVEAFPLNSSGKVDRSALPPVPHGLPAADRVAPATLLEIMLADVYATLLGIGEVGATDSFFDLGGNSLKAMRLVAALDAELDVDVGVTAVFVAPTARQLAALLRDEHGFDDEELGADNGVDSFG